MLFKGQLNDLHRYSELLEEINKVQKKSTIKVKR